MAADRGWKSDAKLQEQHLAMLTSLTKQPGNDQCADCGGRFTRFASVTLGIFICNRCFGLHRNLGAHITRTKCIGLDAWSPEEVNKMKQIGNVRANAFWEGMPIARLHCQDLCISPTLSLVLKPKISF